MFPIGLLFGSRSRLPQQGSVHEVPNADCTLVTAGRQDGAVRSKSTKQRICG